MERETETHDAPQPWNGTSVLVADDDGDMRSLIAKVLTRDGYVVSEARDGHELMKIARAAAKEEGEAPEIIISDVRMPGATGLQAIEEMRGLLEHTVIIVITAFVDAEIQREAQRLGAMRVLRKPFDVDILRAVTMEAQRLRRG